MLNKNRPGSPGPNAHTLAALKSFAKMLFVIAERDKKIEIRKEVIAEMSQFNPWQCFKFLSASDRLGYISCTSLMHFLTANSIHYNGPLEVSAFIDSFAPKHPGRLSYIEFLDVILVNRRLHLRQKALQRSKKTAVRDKKGFNEFL